MSGKALRDLNTVPISERKNENSSKGCFAKPQAEQGDGKERHGENNAFLVGTPISIDESIKSGVEVGNSEVEYIESENLNDVEDVSTSLKVGVCSPDDAQPELSKLHWTCF